MICKNRPEQLKRTFALRTHGAVLQRVLQELDIELPVRTMGEYLKRWGFTLQKPMTRAYEQRPEGGGAGVAHRAVPHQHRPVRQGRTDRNPLG